MIAAILAFTLACHILVRLPVLPDLHLIFVLLPVSLFGMGGAYSKIPCAFVLGTLWTYLVVTEELSHRFPDSMEGHDISLVGEVVGLPVQRDDVTQFIIRTIDGGEIGDDFGEAASYLREAAAQFKGNIRLTWYKPELAIEPGQLWRFNVRANRATGSVNFGLFDYEGWLFLHRIHAKGYVRSGPKPLLIESKRWGIQQVRFSLRNKLARFVPAEQLGSFYSLILGDTSLLSAQQWQTLNQTGTTHLLIISGLHVGLIAALCLALLRRLRMPWAITVSLTIGMTGIYALMAGWGLPVQRALVMTTVVLWALHIGRAVQFGGQFAIALLFVLLIDPLATLSNGFWLSFGAVFLLIYGLTNRTAQIAGPIIQLRALIVSQWVVFVGMLPALGYFLGQLAWLSGAINLVAIPLVTMLIVPSMLLSVFLLYLYAPVGGFFVYVSSLLTGYLWRALDLAASGSSTVPLSKMDLTGAVISMIGALLLLTPKGLVPRWIAVLILLFMLRLPGTNTGQSVGLRLTFFDVGQGLSVMIKTRNSLTLYDTGPTFGSRFSAAKQIVVPSIRQLGHHRLDRVIISHSDNDHAGGLDEIISTFDIGDSYLEPSDCEASWTSDDIRFRLFNVEHEAQNTNNSSCLMLIDTGAHRILLTGDIEAQAELAVSKLQLPWLTLMSAPHHGSDTSSTPPLLNATLPNIVVVSSGYMNRFSHPSPEVLRRYKNRALRVYNTAKDGAVEVTFLGQEIKIRTARVARPAIWRR